MPVNNLDLLEWSRNNISTDCEVTLRAAGSRAYYFAYHECKRWHDELPVPGSDTGVAGGVHQRLINRLSKPAPEIDSEIRKKSRTIAYILGAMKALRHKADYDLDKVFLKQDSEKLISDSEKLIEKIGSAKIESTETA